MKNVCLQPWPHYEADEINAVVDILRSGKVNYWTGQQGHEFEKEFAKCCHARHAVAVANGTVALELALYAIGIGPGNDVIVTPRTFVASASCAVMRGANPIFADVDPDSENVTVNTLEKALTPATKAIIAVHHAGWPCEMDEIMRFAEAHDLFVIEDCAQALGASYNGNPVGGLGHVSAFSFCQDKIMSTGGEGGMLVTNDQEIWERAWSFKDHGKNFESVFYQSHPAGFRWLHDSFGTNWRLTEMQSAIGRAQLKKLDEWSRKRRENAAYLCESLRKHAAIRIPVIPPSVRHAFYRLYVHVESSMLKPGWDRDRIMSTIQATGVPIFTGTCPELYNEKAFENVANQPRKPMPVASALGLSSLAFLVHPTLSEKDLAFVREQSDLVLAEASI